MWLVVVAAAAGSTMGEFVDACRFPDGMVALTSRAERVELTLSPSLDAVRDLGLSRADLGAVVAPHAELEPRRAQAVALCMGSLMPLALEGLLRVDGAGFSAPARLDEGAFRYGALGVTVRYTRTGRRAISIEVQEDPVDPGAR